MASIDNLKTTMKKCQLMPGHITDPQVLTALEAVDRAQFVPAKYASVAYVDEEVKLADGRYMIGPLDFARLLAFAGVKPQDKVLIVGCGMGYSVAVMAEMADKIIAVENEPELVNHARQQLNKYRQVEIVTAPLTAGYAGAKPFDLIFIEGGVQAIPDSLLAQLNEGGRLVTVEVGATRPDSNSGLGHALKVIRRGDNFEFYRDFDVSVPLLRSFAAKKGFVF